MTQTIYIDGVDEPIVCEKHCPRSTYFYGQPFIQDPMSNKWYPTSRIRCIEADI
jgi:hypothetical protein